MRSVGTKRSSARNVRGKSARRVQQKPARSQKAAAKEPARETFGRRAHFRDGPVSRFLRDLRRRLTFRRPVLQLTGLLIGAAAIVGLFAAGYVRAALETMNAAAATVSADAGFGISKLHLSGERRTPPESVLAALGFKPGQSIFAADLQSARARLMLLPWVARADVTRRYPDTISVGIVEKRPFALWQSARGLFVIERSGAVITKSSAREFPRLPVFIGGAPGGGDELVDEIAGRRAVVARVRAMERVSGRRWNLILDDGVIVKLPEKGWKKQLDVLEHLIVDKGILERDITEIDLRSPENYFFVLHGEKMQAARGDAA